MNRILFGLIFGLLLVAACRQPGVEPTRCRDGRCTYTILENKALEITRDTATASEYITITGGTKSVFSYEYVARDDRNIADDEYTERIYFEIDPDSTSFSFTDADLANIQACMVPICFCPPEVVDIREGTIQGTQVDDTTWEIEVDVMVDRFGSVEERQFTTTYEVE